MKHLDLIAVICIVFFQAEDGIRDLVRSRGLGDVYKRQIEQLRDSKNFKPNPAKNQKSFFERMKDYFE